MTEKKWTNASIGVQAEIVTASGGRSKGRIMNWTGPGECELDNGKRGLLVETWQRRVERAERRAS
jgi:hypothetical protein